MAMGPEIDNETSDCATICKDYDSYQRRLKVEGVTVAVTVTVSLSVTITVPVALMVTVIGDKQ